MALRFLSAIALAVLAVAWPTAVADGTSPDPSSAGADAALPSGLAAPFDPLASASSDPLPAPSDPSVPSVPSDPSDPSGLVAFAVDAANGLSLMAGAGIGTVEGKLLCRPYSITLPGPNTPVTETVAVDPDGCLRSFLRRAIGWTYEAQLSGVAADGAAEALQPFL